MAQLWLALYVKTARSAKNVGMAAQRMRDYVEPFIGQKLLADVGPDDVRAHRLWLHDQHLAPRTVRHILGDVRCLFSWAVERGAIERSPFPRRVMPRIQERPPDRLTDLEIESILDIPEPHAFVIRLALATGLRWGELCRARGSDVSHGMLVVHQTKSSRLRRVPLTPAIAAEISERGNGRLVEFSEGASNSFNKVVCRKSRVPRFHVHQLRHTFACRWIESGGSLPALQQILGHASITTTQQYARLSDEHVRREAARINGAATLQRPLAS